MHTREALSCVLSKCSTPGRALQGHIISVCDWISLCVTESLKTSQLGNTPYLQVF